MRPSTVISLLLFASVNAGCALELDEPDVVEAEQGATVTLVPDLEGLPGYYRRVPYFGAPLGELRSVWLVGSEAEGEYTRTVASLCVEPGCNVEAGNYWAVPNNPVMGFAFIGFFGLDGDASDYYVIDFITHDLFGRIETLQLRKLYEDTLGLPFVVVRIF